MYRDVDQMPMCANCGILIPAQELIFEHHGVRLYSCSKRCQRVYDEYKHPRHHEQITATERSGFPGLRLGYVPADRR